MNVRLALCLTCATVAFGFSSAGCGDDSTPATGDDGSVSGSSSGGSSGTSSGFRSGSASGSVSGSTSGSTDASTDSTVRDSAGDAPDSTLGDTGGGETGTESGTQETGVDTGPGDSGGDVADAGIADTGAGDVSDAGVVETGGGGGPACRVAADAGLISCNLGEHCCVNAVTRTGACAATCAADAGNYPVDCSGSAGPANCGQTAGDAAVCCGNLVLTGTANDAGVCNAAGLVSQCAPAPQFCPDNPPQDCSQAPPPGYVLRLCSATSDCIGDRVFPDGGPDGGFPRGNCCSFGSPIRWCVDGLTATSPTATCLP